MLKKFLTLFANIIITTTYTLTDFLCFLVKKISQCIKKEIINETKKEIDNSKKFSLRSFFYENDIELIRLIIKSGININCTNGHKENALFSQKNPEIIKLLIESGINVNQLDIDGCNVLFYCENFDNTYIIFKENGVRKIKKDLSCSGITIDTVKLLIEAGIDINHINKFGEHCLRYQKNPEIVKLLIEAGANVNYINRYGEHCLHYQENPEIVKLLINAGAC